MWRNFRADEIRCTAVTSDPVLREATVTAKAAVACLILLSARRGTGVTPKAGELGSDLDDTRQLPISEFILMAAEFGLAAQYVCRDWDWLKLETSNGPVLLLLKNGNTVVAMAVDGNQEIVISDPLYNNGKILTLPRKELEQVWDGDALTVVPHPLEGVVCRTALNREQKNGVPAQAATKRVPRPLEEGVYRVVLNRERQNSIPAPAATKQVPRPPEGEVYRIVLHREQQINLPAKVVTQRRSAKTYLLLLSATLAPAIVVLVMVGREPAIDKMLGLTSPNRSYEPLLPAAAAGNETHPAYLGVRAAAAATAASPGSPSGDAPLAVFARPSEEAVSALRARGDALFSSGDIVAARLFYERAAEGGDGKAALQLGETYDPEFLKRAGIMGIRGDSATAKRWYRQASELGASEARILLNSAADR